MIKKEKNQDKERTREGEGRRSGRGERKQFYPNGS